MAADTQFVRVDALRSNVLSDEPPLDDVRVLSVDRTTDQQVDWTPLKILLTNGEEGNGFAAVFKPEIGHTYDLRVIKGGTIAATATTVLPSPVQYHVGSASGDTALYQQAVLFLGRTEKPFDLELRYTVTRPGSELEEILVLGYNSEGRTIAAGWEFDVHLKHDQVAVSRMIGWPLDGPALNLLRISAIARIQSDEWDLGDNGSSLENAHGFFGSIGQFELPWMLDSTSVGIIGFVDKQKPF